MFIYNFDEHANDVIGYAFSEARQMGHQFIGTEHLILGLSMLTHASIQKTFQYYKITPERIRTEILKRIGRGNDWQGIEDYTTRAKRCLDKSKQYAEDMGSQEIIPEHIFISIMTEKNSNGYLVLSALSLNVMHMIKWVFDNTMTENESNVIKRGKAASKEIHLLALEEDYDIPSLDDTIHQMTVNLTELAKDNVLDDIYGRKDEINRMIQVLQRRTKNNPCLIGEPGIGKSAIVNGLAKAIASGNVPETLKEKQILSVNIGALVAGTMYRGQFEQRMQKLIEVVIQSNQYMLFFDEIHGLVGLGATQDKSLDALGLLKPYLTTGQIQIIGTTTESEYNQYIETDHALSRRFIPIRIEAPSQEETRKILLNIKFNYETHHGVSISEGAIDAAIKLSCRYMSQRQLPDKAIDLIDEACSRKRLENVNALKIIDELKYRLNQLKKNKEQAILAMDLNQASKFQFEEKRILDHIEKNDQTKLLMSNSRLVIETEDIEKVVSEWMYIPVQKLTTREKEQLSHLNEALSALLIGQSEAVDTVARALKRSRLGIKDKGKPIGSFLFIGPTGVGKTELSKAIASVFYGSEKNMVRFDMSEYMERHSASKLIGSPPGYEGNREGGFLTNALQRQPYSVLVFDEVEKAHIEVLNILLQMMDEGKITDGRGITVDAKNALIIMTSNIGVATLHQKVMGFGDAESDAEHTKVIEKLRNAAKDYFNPEFINRIDEIVVFNTLNKTAISQIIDLQLGLMRNQFAEEGISLSYDESILPIMTEACYSEVYGARPIKRYIDRAIKDRVADILLNSSERPIDIEVRCKDSELTVERKA